MQQITNNWYYINIFLHSLGMQDMSSLKHLVKSHPQFTNRNQWIALLGSTFSPRFFYFNIHIMMYSTIAIVFILATGKINKKIGREKWRYSCDTTKQVVLGSWKLFLGELYRVWEFDLGNPSNIVNRNSSAILLRSLWDLQKIHWK